jgi:hypothetical protein
LTKDQEKAKSPPTLSQEEDNTLWS